MSTFFNFSSVYQSKMMIFYLKKIMPSINQIWSFPLRFTILLISCGRDKGRDGQSGVEHSQAADLGSIMTKCGPGAGGGTW